MTHSTLKSQTLLFVLLYLVLFPLTGSTQENLKISVPTQRIDSLFANWDNPNNPGIAVGIVSDGKILFTKGYGSANLENNIPITANTKFHLGTLSNQFTAFAILLLADEGKLSLDDDVRQFILTIPNFGKKITIKHLLSHTSGLPNLSTLKSLAGWHRADIFTKEQAFQLINQQKELNSAPGTEYQFNNAGFMLLKEVISNVSGQAYTTYVKEHIFSPLQMSNTVFSEDSETIVKNRAIGYHLVGNDYKNSNLNQSDATATNVYTTIGDLCLWAANFSSPKVGNTTILKQLDAPATLNGVAVEQSNASLRLGQSRYWDYFGTNKLYIIGEAAGYNCKIARFPDQDFATVVLGNAGAYNGYMASLASDLYLENYFQRTPQIETSPAPIVYKKLNTQKLESFCGEYVQTEAYYTRKIYLKKDTLRYLRVESNRENLIAPINNNTFRMLNVYGEVIIKFEESGNKKMMNVSVNDEINFGHIAHTPVNYSTNDLKQFTGEYYCAELGTSYSLNAKNNLLITSHPRLENINFNALTNDLFKGNNRYNVLMEFVRDENKVIKGFHLLTEGVKNIWFKKTMMMGGKIE